MSEIILEIVEGDEGYIVKTSEQTVNLYISMDQSCCEDAGYFMSEDNLDDFIGAELLDVTLVDDALNTKKKTDVYEGGIIFVNLETNRGTLQFVAYNEHNGYYGHPAKITCNQLNYDEYL